jgi:hypothetical protein
MLKKEKNFYGENGREYGGGWFMRLDTPAIFMVSTGRGVFYGAGCFIPFDMPVVFMVNRRRGERHVVFLPGYAGMMVQSTD